MFGSDRNRPKDYRRAVVIDAGLKNTTNDDTLRSERRSAFTKRLTEPTLLEMSGYPTNQDLGGVMFCPLADLCRFLGQFQHSKQTKLAPLDNHGRQIVRLFRTTRKINNCSVERGDDLARRLFP